MLTIKILFIGFFVIALFGFTTQAQIKTVENKKIGPDFTSFFWGRWNGTGEFASHRNISASMSFHFSLDSAWLISEHSDILPNKYKAMMMWGINKTSGSIIACIFDNFGDFRQFASSGWQGDQIILDYADTVGSKKVTSVLSTEKPDRLILK